jgi:hypothetical protein
MTLLKPMPSPNGTNHAKLFIVARNNPVAAYDSATGLTDTSSPDGEVDYNALVNETNISKLASALSKKYRGDDLMKLMNALSEHMDAEGQSLGDDDEDDTNAERNALGIDKDQPIANKMVADAKAHAARKFARIAQDQANSFDRRWGKTAGRVGIDNMGIK